MGRFSASCPLDLSGARCPESWASAQGFVIDVTVGIDKDGSAARMTEHHGRLCYYESVVPGASRHS